MQEDHVSLGWHAARKLRTSVANLRRILAIEMLIASRALDLRAPLQPGAATGAVLELLRTKVAGPGEDRFLSAELEAAYELLASGQVHQVLEAHLPA